jgi:hypothetical protein
MTRVTKHRNQHGAVLFMALIFLVLLTVMAITTFTVGKSTSQVVNNMNTRRTGLQSASQASENGMSSYRIVNNPTAPLYDPVAGTYGGSVTTDVRGDGTFKIKNTIDQQTCEMATPKDPLSLDMNDPVDEGCANSVATQKCFNVTFQYRIKSVEQYGTGDAPNPTTNSVTQGLYVTAQPGAAQNICHGSGGILYF